MNFFSRSFKYLESLAFFLVLFFFLSVNLLILDLSQTFHYATTLIASPLFIMIDEVTTVTTLSDSVGTGVRVLVIFVPMHHRFELIVIISIAILIIIVFGPYFL